MGQLHSNLISIVDQGDGASIVYTNKDGSTKPILFNKDGIYLNGVLSSADAVGSALTPVSRTNNPTLAANSVNANLSVLDTEIGSDVTVTTRTVGPLIVANTINANIQALNTAVGTNAQLSSVKNVAVSNSVSQNLAALDLYKSVRTVKKTIGNVGVVGCDFSMASAANTTQQNFDLGILIPAKCRLLDIMIFTDAAFTNLGALRTTVGTTSAAVDIFKSTNNTVISTIIQPSTGSDFTVTQITAADQHIWVGITPTNNWNSATPVGKMSVYVTTIDLTNI
jgi:hypothetical protein